MDTRLLTYRRLIRFFTKGDTKSLVTEYNDLFCLFLSQLVYFSDAFIIKHLKEIGCDSATIVAYKGPKTVFLRFNGVNYVSVKGLSGRNRNEWPIILNFLAKEHEGTEAHGGFVLTARKLLGPLKVFLEYNPGRIVLTGHSMGGAIATLLSLSVPSDRVVTFGAPKTVEQDAVAAFRGEEITHYRIDTDFVTFLPPCMYQRPGSQVVKQKKLGFRFWDNHKLYTYSFFMMPVLADAAAVSQLSSV